MGVLMQIDAAAAIHRATANESRHGGRDRDGTPVCYGPDGSAVMKQTREGDARVRWRLLNCFRVSHFL